MSAAWLQPTHGMAAARAQAVAAAVPVIVTRRPVLRAPSMADDPAFAVAGTAPDLIIHRHFGLPEGT